MSTTFTSQSRSTDVAIIGAGPYGLSLAAHLKSLGVRLRIFGRPMQGWTEQMPQGMKLKSDGFASSLSAPRDEFQLRDYCAELGIPYSDQGLPVPIEVFSSYALEFQKRYVPEVEDKIVKSLRQTAKGFELELQDGELVQARRVVVAVGIRHYRQVPDDFAKIPAGFVTHSSDHNNLDKFAGKEVTVLGAGASAADVAAILNQAGAKVQLVARRSKIRFHDPPSPKPRSLMQRMRAPKTGLGPGWKVFWCVNAPLVFRHLPLDVRLKAVRLVLSPAPGWFVKQDIVGKVPLHLGCSITSASMNGGKVKLEFHDSSGTQHTIHADHIIAATGYKVDVGRLKFFGNDVLTRIQRSDTAPALSSNFESSVPGLYFVGAAAANTFGPLMCFVFGTRFAARRLSHHLAKSARRPAVWTEVSAEHKSEALNLR